MRLRTKILLLGAAGGAVYLYKTGAIGGNRLEPADEAQRYGATAAADAELADRLVAETGGDLDAAEARFSEEAEGPTIDLDAEAAAPLGRPASE